MTKTISIPTNIYKKIEERVKTTNFSSVDEYITHVLEQVVAKFEREKGGKTYVDEEEEKIKERLRGLGYLE